MSEMESLPCGCNYSSDDGVFLYEPCALDCENYLYLLAEADRQDKPITTLDLR